MLTILSLVLVVVLGALLARMSGGGLGAHLLNSKGKLSEDDGEDLGGVIPFVDLTFLPELLFAAPIGYIGYLSTDLWWVGLLGWAWSYIWMQTGHHTPLMTHFGAKPYKFDGKTNTLGNVVDPMAVALEYEAGDRSYCRLFMGLKGLLIGLPMFPLGLLLAPLWSTSYEIGYKIKISTLYGEYFSGACAYLLVVLSYLFWR
jgi:hypothetical protein